MQLTKLLYLKTLKKQQKMNSLKPVISQFLRKILQMMNQYPSIISWNQQGTQLMITNVQIFSQKVLKMYFRHNKFESFVRQLNMYGFNKIFRNKDCINFRNQYFQKGNQSNFYLIRRKKKQNIDVATQINQQQQQLRDIINKKFQYSIPSLQYTFQQLFQFKSKVIDDINEIKKNMEQLNRQLNPRKSKKIKPLISLIRQPINSIHENFQKSVSEVEKTLKNLQELEKSQQYQTQIIIPQKIYPVKGVQNIEINSSKKIKNEEIDENIQANGGTKFKITQQCSFNSFPSLPSIQSITNLLN